MRDGRAAEKPRGALAARRRSAPSAASAARAKSGGEDQVVEDPDVEEGQRGRGGRSRRPEPHPQRGAEQSRARGARRAAVLGRRGRSGQREEQRAGVRGRERRSPSQNQLLSRTGRRQTAARIAPRAARCCRELTDFGAWAYQTSDRNACSQVWGRASASGSSWTAVSPRASPPAARDSRTARRRRPRGGRARAGRESTLRRAVTAKSSVSGWPAEHDEDERGGGQQDGAAVRIADEAVASPRSRRGNGPIAFATEIAEPEDHEVGEGPGRGAEQGGARRRSRGLPRGRGTRRASAISRRRLIWKRPGLGKRQQQADPRARVEGAPAAAPRAGARRRERKGFQRGARPLEQRLAHGLLPRNHRADDIREQRSPDRWQRSGRSGEANGSLTYRMSSGA